MTEKKTEEVQKALPYGKNYDGGWAAMPNEFMMFYMLHPKFNANTALVHTYLVKNYRTDKKYSFPTLDEMELTLNISRGTVDTALDTLLELGLINKTTHPYFGNNVYTFNEPIRNIDEFMEKYPDAKKRYDRQRVRRERLAARRDAFKWTPPA